MNLLNLSYGSDDDEEEETPPAIIAKPLPDFPVTSPVSAAAVTTTTSNRVYSKGDEVMYNLTDLCVVLEKHEDDFPNYYYTVRITEVKNGLFFHNFFSPS